MKTELILKRDDKSKVVLVAVSNMWGCNEKPQYTVEVFTVEPGKRKRTPVVNTDDYSYRGAPDRDAYIKEAQLKVVTEEEIHQAKIAVWEAAKPSKG